MLQKVMFVTVFSRHLTAQDLAINVEGSRAGVRYHVDKPDLAGKCARQFQDMLYDG